jgi:hypothetical protein
MVRAKELYDEGSSLYSAADYGGAISKFTEALKIVTSEGGDEDHTIRGALLLNIAQSHIHAYEVDADPGHLRAARSIFQRFRDEASRGAGYDPADVAQAERQLTELDEQIEELEQRQAASSESKQPATTSPVDHERDSKEAEIVRTRGIGIGLVVGGVVVTGVGATLLVFGSTFRAHAIESVRQDANDPGLPLDDFDAEQQAHVDDETRKGRYWMISGGVVAGVGLVGVGLGAWQLAKAAKAKKSLAGLVLPGRAATITPWLGPGFSGVSLEGRF